MKGTNVEAKLIEEKYFSNKAYTIKVKLYEHEMARVDVDCKKRFRGRKYHDGYIPVIPFAKLLSKGQQKSDSSSYVRKIYCMFFL